MLSKLSMIRKWLITLLTLTLLMIVILTFVIRLVIHASQTSTAKLLMTAVPPSNKTLS